MTRWSEQRLSSWGNHPAADCVLARPETVSDLGNSLADADQVSVLARGLGRSYGDAALNESTDAETRGVVLTERLDRFIDFDESSGLLHAQAGISLERIIDRLLPRGWFPGVTPGTRHVSLGGAIAADVHGKNHHAEGAFSKNLKSFDLILPTGDRVTCSREQHADLFAATLGGLGLTGTIESARLRLRPVESGWIKVNRVRTRGLEETVGVFEKQMRDRTYSVAWLDCLKRGRGLGRAVVFGGEHATANQAGAEKWASGAHRVGKRSVPFFMPGFALNRFSVGAFNALYYSRHATRDVTEDWGTFFYPLDGVTGWNKIYGKRGFQQWQVVVPFGVGVEGLRTLLDRIAASKRASFLAVLKTMGEHSEGTLGFGRPGWTLALDFAQRPGLNDLLGELDDEVIKMGGVRYLAKDASLTRTRFDAMYPEAEGFRTLRKDIDPEQRVASDLSRRLGL